MSIGKHPIWHEIDTAQYLFLMRIFEPRDNAVTVLLEEAVANKSKRGPTMIAGINFEGESWPIEPTLDTRVFLLEWTNYVSYCVTEEMHGSTGSFTSEEEYTGRLLRIYSKSHFLDFVARSTGAHFNAYRHYGIACQNHLLDIVSRNEPTLSVLTRDEAAVM